jgi:hypothetical protein
MDRALRQAREKHPELWKAVERVPRSDRQAKEILEIAAAIDVIAVGLLPAVEAEMALEDEQRRATARERQMQEAADRVTSRIVAEVMLLAEEGALDGERKFGRLKSLSDELRSFRDGGQAPDPDPSPRP